MSYRSAQPDPISAYTPDSFAYFTIQKRIPKIMCDVATQLSGHALKDPRWKQLEDAIVQGGPIDIRGFYPETAYWENRLSALEGAYWRELSFFELEFVFYLGLRSLVQELAPGFDMFRKIRRDALQDAMADFRHVFAQDSSQPLALSRALNMALGGNTADLSQLDAQATGQRSTNLLVDQRPAVMERLRRSGASDSIVILADNAGSELGYDLLLTDALIQNFPSKVILHLKNVPMFVSDALICDVEDTIEAFCAQSDVSGLSEVGLRLRTALNRGELELQAPCDWSEPRFLDNLSPPVAQSLKDAHIVISKGDLNYRRFFEDRAWNVTTPVSEASVADMNWAVALRVLKSDCMVGLLAADTSILFQKDPSWRSNGQHAVVQRVDRGKTTW
ncbi:MAG: protein-glutamate O-methyltransferase family protein [Myxococcales bacterium]|nr:protein-glutamate O-methyltransferase family protein [Myxococcales bacterium]